jgi:hypothetical protein
VSIVKKIMRWLLKEKHVGPTRPPACPFCRGAGRVLAVCTCYHCQQATALGYGPMQAQKPCPICSGTRVVPSSVAARARHEPSSLFDYARSGGRN